GDTADAPRTGAPPNDAAVRPTPTTDSIQEHDRSDLILVQGKGRVRARDERVARRSRAPSAVPSAIVRAMFEQPLPRWLAWATDPEAVRPGPLPSGSAPFTGL